MVPPAHHAWQIEFMQAFGDPQTIQVPPTMGASRDRTYYLSPTTSLPPLCSSTMITPVCDPRNLPDGAYWHPQNPMLAQPRTLRAVYPRLLHDHHQGHASSSDSATVRDFMIQLPGLAGTLRYAGPMHLAHWLGLPKNYCYSIQTAFPCESSDTCGQHTLCNPCSEA